MDRRRFLQTIAGSATLLGGLGLGQLVRGRRRGPQRSDGTAQAAGGTASRLIVFYFPDGVPGPSSDGMPSEWHAQGNDTSFTLPSVLSPLAAHRDSCLFLNGVSMGPADVGSHPGGAKKLLTGVDGGNGESIDRFLARTVGAASPFGLVYLGAMANQNNAAGDKHISYVGPGVTAAPDDNPLSAFSRLFANAAPSTGGAPMTPDPDDVSVIDTVLADLNALKNRLGTLEQQKLDAHLTSVREVERRVKGLAPAPTPVSPGASCAQPTGPSGIDANRLYDPGQFPAVLKAQVDLMVLAMACGLTKVGVIQCSHHTSELLMSRFPGSPMYDPSFDMRSHQASHYGPRHDLGKREYRDFVAQRTWFVQQFASLLDQLKARPDGNGTMLDTSVVLLCSEISDGNTHAHDNMPFILAGRAGGALRTGRVLDAKGRHHSQLLAGLAQVMGAPSFVGGNALPGLL
jgi:hypothetical protein